MVCNLSVYLQFYNGSRIITKSTMVIFVIIVLNLYIILLNRSLE